MIGLLLLTFIALGFVIVPLVRKKVFITSIVLGMLLPALALLLYFCWGNSRGWLDYFLHQQQATQVNAELKNPEAVVDKLRAYLALHPQSPKGWYLLGKIDMHAGDYERAVDALSKAHAEDSGNIDYTTAYAEALFFSHDRKLMPEAQQLLQQVLQQDTNNIAANNLLAINAYHQGKYKEAIHYWEILIPLFDPQSEDEKALLQMISRAEKQDKVN